MSRLAALDDSLNLLRELNNDIITSEQDTNSISSYTSKKVVAVLLQSFSHYISCKNVSQKRIDA